jgi:hypothetical protein
LSFSAVPKVNTSLTEEIEKDRKIRRDVQGIMRDLSHVKASIFAMLKT